MKRAALMLILCLFSSSGFSCLIFIFTGGKHVLVGNHEDWTARDGRMRFIPGNNKQLGAIVFDFESEGLIQGGMNTVGLFFDGTATPFVPMDFSDKEEFKGADMWPTLLQTCKTTNDAVTFVQRYKIPDLEKVHLFFADRSGQSVIVGAYDGKLTFTWKSQPQQVLTNFNITDPEYGGEQSCPRFATAMQILSNPDDAVETAKRVLQQTTQGDLTVYSSLFDLTDGSVTVYYQGDFSKSVTINLASELKLGAHSLLISKSVH